MECEVSCIGIYVQNGTVTLKNLTFLGKSFREDMYLLHFSGVESIKMDVVSFPKYRLNYRIESKKIKLNWCTNFTLSDVYSDLNAINIIANYVIHFKNCHFNGLQKKDFHFISVLQQLTIHDCTFTKPETQSIYVIATSNVQIQNTTIQNCDSNPLLLENIQKVDISNSFFKRCPRGLTLMNIADTNLDGCHFIENKELNYDGGAINSIGSGMQIRNCRLLKTKQEKVVQYQLLSQRT